jgi:hypothetical protein
MGAAPAARKGPFSREHLALISPADTGLIYTTVTSRIS